MSLITRRDSATLHLDFASGAGTGRYKSRLARTGAQRYETGEEHRDASEVFHAASLVSLRNAKVQVSHASGSPVVGTVREPFARIDGIDGESYLQATLEIFDPATRARIDAGELREISMGYACELVGSRQTRLRYDHCALLDNTERARCGAECRITFDSQPTQRKPSVMSCAPCSSAPRLDAVARRDAFRANAPNLASLSDADVDICLERIARIDQQAAETAAALATPSLRIDSATESRIDSASAAAGVNRNDVADHIRMNHPVHRGYAPSEEDIAHAVHTLKLRSYFGRNDL